MHRSIVLAALLAGCLGLAAAAEARDRHGHGAGHGRKFDNGNFHGKFHHGNRGRFDHGDFRGKFDHGNRGRFEHGAFDHGRRFGPPSGLRAFALPQHHRHGFGHRHSGLQFGHRRQVLRFVERPPLPLSQQPGHRILAGRQILPFVSARPATFSQGFGSFRSHRFPTFVRVAPGPGFPARHHGFGGPRSRGGLTIIVRDPAAMRPWR